MRFDQPTDADVRKLNRLFNAIQAARTLYPAMPSSYIAAFLAVASKPGLGVTEYAKDLGTIQPIMSRILLEIGRKSRLRKEGLGLVDVSPDPQDLRINRHFLTPKGRTLLASMLKAMGPNN